MPGAGLQVVAEQSPERSEDVGRGRRVQAMAAEVDPQAGDLERAGHAPDPGRALEHDDLVPGGRGPPGGGEAGGPRPDDGDHAMGCGSAGTSAPAAPVAAYATAGGPW